LVDKLKEFIRYEVKKDENDSGISTNKEQINYNEKRVIDLDPQFGGVITEKTYFDVLCSVGQDKLSGRLIFGMYGREHPLLVKQFGDLCENGGLSVRGERERQSYLNSYIGVAPGTVAIGTTEPVSSELTNSTKLAPFEWDTDVNAAPTPSKTPLHPDRVGTLLTSCPDPIPGSPIECATYMIALGYKAADTGSSTLQPESLKVIGQVMYNGNNIIQHMESSAAAGAEEELPVVVACGRLPAMSAALEVNANEVLDENGKNINQIIR
jgi:hypothetical protein